MEKEINIKRVVCDFCSSDEHAFDKCLRCGMDICFDCKTTKAIEYKHAIYFTGSEDGTYCLDCNDVLIGSGDELYNAYKKTESLVREFEGFSKDFQKRQEKAESELRFIFNNRSIK